ncbi:peptidoglycan-binding protein [Halieaceae bacterium IMCC14734]|uniref:Peptidoglycan-binding protein n=2 Tax=Candidatus Litorirhabdus singularis TaxID=2518993 RepID=A0ABT3TN01_9GAMM|nr:peptidoglycan-binding protein [Candidatus Litorirhabdus singularis]
MDETVDEVIESQTSQASSEPSKPQQQQPLFDQRLVADTQSQLNRLGYNVGAVDGLYGNGTRQAIVSFQQDQNLAVNGEPSSSLLSQMESSRPLQENVAENALAITSAPESTSGPEASTDNYSSEQKVVKDPQPAQKAASARVGVDFDIVGVKLGMTPDQVVSALKAHNELVRIEYTHHKNTSSSYHISGITPTPKLPEHLKMIFASVNGNAESIQIEFAEPPTSNVVRSVERQNKFDRSAMPSGSNLKAALENKYGTPILEKGSELTWNHFDRNANLQKQCLMSINNGAYYTIGALTKCGPVVLADLRRGGDGIVAFMKVKLFDPGDIDLQKSRTYEYRVQLQKERDQENLDRANQNSAPKL